jgi:hypothetical protein
MLRLVWGTSCLESAAAAGTAVKAMRDVRSANPAWSGERDGKVRRTSQQKIIAPKTAIPAQRFAIFWLSMEIVRFLAMIRFRKEMPKRIMLKSLDGG